MHFPISGSHTIGIVKGQESYGLLKNSFSAIFSTLNDIIKQGHIKVDDIDVPVEIFVGGDYKVIKLAFQINFPINW